MVKVRQIIVLLIVFSLLSSIALNIPGYVQATNDLSQVAYYDRVKQAFNLTLQQENMLRDYGFTVVETPYDNSSDSGFSGAPDSAVTEAVFSPWGRFEDFYLGKVYNPDLPVFITTDSILHLFHVVFDCSLRIAEEETFYPMVSDVTQYAYQKALNDYESTSKDGSARYWAIRNATVYFAVAESLIIGVKATVPSELDADLNFFLDHIYATEPEFVFAGGWSFPKGATTQHESSLQFDFTQFTVRGHYVGAPTLERYFRTMMWYGNFPVCIPREDEEYGWSLSHVDCGGAVYARDILKANPSYFDKWTMIYKVTGVLVGESDSVGPLSLETALENTFGERTEYLDLVTAPGGLTALSTELSKPEYNQKILGQAIEDVGRYPIVFQFMGQRYVPDSFMFQMLCYDKTGRNSDKDKRILPKGLDVFAVLGSERARQLLNEDFDFKNYPENMANLTSQFGNMTEEEWNHSSYTSWIYALDSLTDVNYDVRYPEFMQNLAWKDEKLNTALGSWAQLRHDTILYAKQTYIPISICSYPEAFAEPNPTFYARMQQLTQRTLDAYSILPTSFESEMVTSSLALLKDAAQKLEVISTKELAQQPLTDAEITFMKNVAHNENACGTVQVGWYLDTIRNMAMVANYTAIQYVPVIADVATFPPGDIEYPPQILHVGTGGVNGLIVLYPMGNGTLAAAVGPVFSYYEFPLIGTKRLNDLEWRNMLAYENRTAYLPSWVKDVYALAQPIPIVPEQPTIVALILTATAVVILGSMKRRKNKMRPSPKTG
jgi:hypothetical protein